MRSRAESPEIRLETLQDLASVLDDLVDAESQQFESEEFRTQALGLARQRTRLEVRAGCGRPLLRELQAEVRQLRGTIRASHWLEVTAQTEDLVEGAHPLVHLLILVAQAESLSDEDWAELHLSVREAFGPRPAVAAARGSADSLGGAWVVGSELGDAATCDGSHARDRVGSRFCSSLQAQPKCHSPRN